MINLFTYFRSTASYRVRLALAYKGIAYSANYINLRENEQNKQYKDINPSGLVPVLQTDLGIISQSLAILEFIEKQYPTPPLWLDNPFEQAQAMAIAQSICCDIHPLNNLRVLKYLTNTLKLSEEQKNDWYHHWIHEGFKALEKQLQQTSGNFCIKNTISVAELCLVPQVYNANRFGVDLGDYPIIRRINELVLEQEWTTSAVPEAQADA